MGEDSLIQMSTHIGAGDGVGFARIDLQIVGNASFNQLLDILHGVFEVDVVVAGALRDE